MKRKPTAKDRQQRRRITYGRDTIYEAMELLRADGFNQYEVCGSLILVMAEITDSPESLAMMTKLANLERANPERE
jgi:hypothetical protein